MDVLIDTNVFIQREGDWRVPEPLQELENLLKTEGHTILVHPLSKQEIRNYENDEGRETAESKIATYAELGFPSYPNASSTEFRKHIREAEQFNDEVDNALLYTVFDGRVDLLVTEDKGIHSKAESLGIESDVLSIEDARRRFKEERPAYEGPPSIKKRQVGDLDIDDPIFDSLKDDYDFRSWFESIPDERDAYVNWSHDDALGAVLILKPNEAEVIGEEPELGKRDRLKICTLKVASDRRGSKIGELLVSIAIREAVEHELEEIYLTHHVEPNDYLVDLIAEYGFQKASETTTGESVFVKRVTPGPGDDPDPFEVHRRFYPSFYDGPSVSKFVVPIQPQFHGRLFPTYKNRQPRLSEFSGDLLSEGNAIKKAYLSHANTRQIEANDVLLFYRTHDHKELTSIGVCEQVKYGVTDASEVRELVGERSVFTNHEIDEQVESPTTVILFKWHFDLANPLHYQVLLNGDVLSGPPQTIQEIDEPSYQYVRENGGVDGRFTVH
ncbi:GNAT family N-acetyltransferase [Halarchaeum nitratireducens]|nr:GNAT family N-acetyltransferase [Halarchaeum nitratireducens]